MVDCIYTAPDPPITQPNIIPKGLRLDYFIVPAEDAEGGRGVVRVHDCSILHDATTLSDHCPISLTLELLDN